MLKGRTGAVGMGQVFNTNDLVQVRFLDPLVDLEGQCRLAVVVADHAQLQDIRDLALAVGVGVGGGRHIADIAAVGQGQDAVELIIQKKLLYRHQQRLILHSLHGILIKNSKTSIHLIKISLEILPFMQDGLNKHMFHIL